MKELRKPRNQGEDERASMAVMLQIGECGELAISVYEQSEGGQVERGQTCVYLWWLLLKEVRSFC